MKLKVILGEHRNRARRKGRKIAGFDEKLPQDASKPVEDQKFRDEGRQPAPSSLTGSSRDLPRAPADDKTPEFPRDTRGTTKPSQLNTAVSPRDRPHFPNTARFFPSETS